ncbi:MULTISPECIES: MaoC family dehydratase [Rhizobium]|jgi:acyl dehydratase|uniref:MaoC domain-containing protein dehydratase n=1 Tax=Rhizobium grahamii CCGE 502 TaxID=990285 RepID=S3H8W9_9HYPH|nr:MULTISPECIES: MaoC family dehydratase [Rhizobium]EPE95327.1 MaoC domain-containing protein dehydratase [Rhizobium grahamii CCGE 502]MBB3317263.1 acyl dehydratase [Rhizobium sp. BK181]MBB3541686.1 acyl dehydratase [Rhizobium sp. BK399]MCS3740735.1 acyl dehydratase [Rhizobium sp. BK661]MCS4092430.1 acyl dehydratase [Rhizobium sp. BK176]
MVKEISLADVRGLVGTETGLSDWIVVDQTMIDAFAHATNDHQYIHVDPERAAASPFGGTIAHGFLTLSLLSAMNYNGLPKVREQTMGINYGFENVRFLSPVKSGARIRGHFVLAEARFRGAGMLMTTYEVSIEIENEKKPALTARWITIIQFDPKDRPEDA